MSQLENAKDAAKLQRRMADLWYMLDRLWGGGNGEGMMNGTITEIRIRRPQYPGGPTTIVVKGVDEQGRFVGFSEAVDTPLAVHGVLARIQAGQMKWREDRPWQGPKADVEPDGSQ